MVEAAPVKRGEVEELVLDGLVVGEATPLGLVAGVLTAAGVVALDEPAGAVAVAVAEADELLPQLPDGTPTVSPISTMAGPATTSSSVTELLLLVSTR
jgi:hypothetical protein